MVSPVTLTQHRGDIVEPRYLSEPQEKALSVAITATDYRLSLLNELRSGVATDAQVDALRVLLHDLSSRVKGIEARSGGMKDGLGYIIAAITIVGAIVALVIRN